MTTSTPLGWVLARWASGAGLALASGIPLLNVYGTGPGVHLIALAVSPSALLALLLDAVVVREVRAPAISRPVAVVAGALVSFLLVPAGTASSVTPFTRLHEVVSGTWHRVLSVALPVPLTHAYADGVAIVLSLSTAAVCSLTARGRATQALGVAVVVWAGAVALGVGGQHGALLLAMPMAALSCVALLVRSRSGATGATSAGTANRAATAARPTAALLAVVVLLLSAALLAAGIPHRAPRDPRDVAVPADRHPFEASPLALLSARLRTPTQAVFVARGAAAATGSGWLQLTYADYDGAGWQSPVHARDLPAALPPRLPRGTEDHVVLTLLSPQLLLPHTGTVVAATTPGLRFDPASGALVAGRPVTSADVETVESSPTSTQLGRAAVPTRSSPALTAVPSCTPGSLTRLVQHVAAAGGLPDEQVARLEEIFRALPFVFDPAAPPGSGCARLEQFLSTGRGTSEQFSSAFALAVRQLGIPARLAVGFGPGRAGPGGTATVTNADARAWVQVDFAKVGWVDFFPTPSGRGAFRRPAEKQPALSKVRRAVAAGHETNRTQQAAHGVAKPASAADGLARWVWVLVPVLALLTAVSTPTGVRVIKRRRRLGGGSAEARVLAAWFEALQPLREGAVIGADSTLDEIAALPLWQARSTKGGHRAVGASASGTSTASAVAELTNLVEIVLYRPEGAALSSSSRVLDLGQEVRRTAFWALPLRKRMRYVMHWN